MKKHINPFSVGSFIVFTFLMIFTISAVLGISKFYNNSDTRHADMLKKTIQKAAVQCYSLEGSYPSDLEYLEKNYGIVLNKDKFYYHYEIFASNIAPQIEVLPIEKVGR